MRHLATAPDSPNAVIVMRMGMTLLSGRMTRLAVGYKHVCAWLNDGTMRCRGGDDDRLTPMAAAGLTGATAAGIGRVCAPRSGGQQVCWGWDALRQFGDGAVNRHMPTQAGSASGNAAMAGADGFYPCVALMDDGTYRRGCSADDQLGDNTTNRTMPIAVWMRESDVAAMAAGIWRSCPLAIGDTLFSGGGSVVWRMNDGSSISWFRWDAVSGLVGVVA